MTFISYAQNYEDVILWRALKNVKNGFYVDVGAAWPDTHSVTKIFYDHGWAGINIEPNPEFYARLSEQRPRDINLQIAVANKDGENSLNLFSDTGLSTLDAQVAREHIKNRFDCVSINITTATLASLLNRFLPKKQEIHFLKIDVEGLEAEVLTSNDWSLYRPWIVMVESTLPLSQVESHSTWEPRLLAASYTLAYADGLNRFYLENSHLDLLAVFKYPPNVFDEFVLATQVTAEESQRLAEARAITAEESQRLAEARAITAEESQRLAEARAITAEESQRLAEARAITAEESQRLAEARAITAEESQRLAEARAIALFDELTSLIGSKSWKVTKPLRESIVYARRLRGYVRFASMRIAHMRPRILFVRMLKSMKSAIEHKPAVRKFFLMILNKFPRYKLRISRALGSEAKDKISEDAAPDGDNSLRLKRIEKIVCQVLDGLKDQK